MKVSDLAGQPAVRLRADGHQPGGRHRQSRLEWFQSQRATGREDPLAATRAYEECRTRQQRALHAPKPINHDASPASDLINENALLQNHY
jgi:hypothetical protein